jgi:DNA-binding CsgD family transcriptional regulator
MELIDRCSERGVLDRLIEAVRAGESRALVVSGVAGVGKTALLEYLAEQASGCRVVRAAGVQSEMELPYAALHQVCGPVLGSLERLPVPQRDALRIAFGLTVGPAPDRFLVGLAVLSLLADVAEQRPLMCLVDDEQWLDRSSAQVLGFVARRLVAESVGLVFAARIPSGDLAGLPGLVVEGLRAADAQALLESALMGRLDTRVRDRVVAETHGNPLALLELPRGLTPQELAGGFGIPAAVRLSGGVEESFRRRIDVLPEETRRLLLIAAAEPLGDPALVWGAAARLGISAEAAEPAVEAGLVEFAERVRFRHPLVRSVVYSAASSVQKRLVHGALAQVTDAQQDPDRRAWHRAHAVAGPDDDVAAELERSAARAQARGGPAAAAAFLGRATMLTLDPTQRTERALAAASAHVQAGAFDAAHEMLSIAETQSLTDFQDARIDMTRAQVAFAESRGGETPALLLKAAQRLEPIDVDLARATYLRALESALFAGELALGGEVQEVARAAAAAPRPQRVRAPDLFLDGLAALFNIGYQAAVPILRRALDVFGTDLSPEEELRWHSLAFPVASLLWEDHRFKPLSDRYLELVRGLGALSELPMALTTKAITLAYAGELTAASELLGELHAAMEAFAERAKCELKAAGETARKPSVPTDDHRLTAQEAQIARMARDGLSNPEIGTRLFLSTHTVHYHLGKIFTKLGISSRTQLERVLLD